MYFSRVLNKLLNFNLQTKHFTFTLCNTWHTWPFKYFFFISLSQRSHLILRSFFFVHTSGWPNQSLKIVLSYMFYIFSWKYVMAGQCGFLYALINCPINCLRQWCQVCILASWIHTHLIMPSHWWKKYITISSANEQKSSLFILICIYDVQYILFS